MKMCRSSVKNMCKNRVKIRLHNDIRIPQDIGIVAFDDYPLSQVIEPQLTIVDINVRDLGRQAGKLIIDIIKHPNKQIQTFVTTSNIVERKSTRRTKQT